MGSIIKVNEYKDFNNNAIMTSDGAGNVTVNAGGLKNIPAFSVFLTANQTLTTNTWTKLNLNSEQWDTDSTFDVSNYRFTVPSGEAGKYLFQFAAGTATLSSSTVAALQIYKNGSSESSSFVRSYPNQSTGGYPNKTIVFDLEVGDYIELYGQHTKGSDCEFDYRYTFLQGEKLIGA